MGAIVGGIAGAVILFGLLVAVFILRQTRRKQDEKQKGPELCSNPCFEVEEMRVRNELYSKAVTLELDSRSRPVEMPT